ncbi:MAG TPA: peptidylprolyl isomerase, partial [Bacteroidales bacterium]|nr:peptidylprolyl isomerase [Bacteroidales bacterium]
MIFKLYDATPKHKANFEKLIDEGYFNDVLFHRVINSFMIQGGDPNSRNAKPGQLLGDGGPDYTIPAEFVDTIFHKKGVIAAAREGDDVNPNMESSASQFYIVQGYVFTD